MTSPLPPSPLQPPLRFREATLLSYRLFDVADEIDLDRAQQLLAGAATRLKLTRERSEYLEIPRAPLTVHLGEREVRGESGRPYRVDAHARLFGFGTLSVRYELPLADGIDSEQAAALVKDFEGAKDVEISARAEITRLCDRLQPALDTPHLWEGFETYAVLLARGLVDGTAASALGEDPRVARILLAEIGPEALSLEQVRDATQHHFSYAEGDLCVIDWNAAVVIDPSLYRDVPDILEFATAQLLEFRFYDDIVDREMERLYDHLKKREPFLWKIGGRYGRLGRQLNRRLVETVEFVERVDNAVKVIADSFIARVYSAALESFRVPSWLAAVNRKQDLTRQVAEVLSGESQAHTSHLLEIIVILLILYEIVAPMLLRVAGH
ncbi:MAG: hypothetical protein HY721_07100 [Planctomycetes bacterium]|nr:hypothetical protein [Planctomycetota bacterium]